MFKISQGLQSKLPIKKEFKFVDKMDSDPQIACNIVDHIFDHIALCLREDKSKIKINLMTKSFIKNILTDNVRTGIKNFVTNMNDKEVAELLEEIQNEIDKRIK